MTDASNVLLVPVDGSQGADAAVRHAAYLAKGLNLPIQLLFAFPATPMEQFGLPGDGANQKYLRYFAPEAFEELRNENAQRAFAKAREVLAQSEIPVTEVILPGNPAEAIVKYANQTPGAMIIMGRRGLSRLQEILIGSVSQRVVHQAECPVTLVH